MKIFTHREVYFHIDTIDFVSITHFPIFQSNYLAYDHQLTNQPTKESSIELTIQQLWWWRRRFVLVQVGRTGEFPDTFHIYHQGTQHLGKFWGCARIQNKNSQVAMETYENPMKIQEVKQNMRSTDINDNDDIYYELYNMRST